MAFEAAGTKAAITEADEVHLGSVSVGVASTDLHTGNKFMPAFILDCNMGPDISSFVRWARSGLSGLAGGSLLLTEDVGEERPLSNGSLDIRRSFFSD